MAGSQEKPLRIVALAAENVKRLKAVRITPDGSPVVPIRGRNAQGKSSVLDAIEYALAGTRSIPERPIRDGNNRAEIVVETEEFTVTRVFTPSGSTLKITSKDGTAEFKRPQELLDRLTGSLTFDPLAFTRLKPADQCTELARIAGVDLATHDAEARALDAQRRDLGRDVKRLETEVAAISVPDGTPDAPIELVTITARHEALRQQAEQNAAKRRAVASQRNAVARLRESVEDLAAKLEVARKQLADSTSSLAADEQAASRLVDPDVSGLAAELAAAQATNASVLAKRQKAAKASELASASRAHAEADAAVAAHRAALTEAIAGAQLPVPGLALSASGVMLNGLPFAQVSSAEQLRVATAIAIAQNPRLRIALIRDGSLLDTDSQRLLKEIAEQNNLQVWLEMVGSSADGSGIVIEDGEVVAPSEMEL